MRIDKNVNNIISYENLQNECDLLEREINDLTSQISTLQHSIELLEYQQKEALKRHNSASTRKYYGSFSHSILDHDQMFMDELSHASDDLNEINDAITQTHDAIKKLNREHMKKISQLSHKKVELQKYLKKPIPKEFGEE